MLKQHPGKLDIKRDCILEALDISLNLNCSKYEDSKGDTIFARPIHGTAMGPCHSCDFVDIYMGELDKKLAEKCPVPLLTSILSNKTQEDLRHLDWSRYKRRWFYSSSKQCRCR